MTAPPELLRLFPEPAVRLAVEDVYGDLTFPARETRPYVFINVVSSLDGKATVGGKAAPIGSKMDRTLMNRLRAGADAVMTGAGTLRAERMTLGVPEDLARETKAQPLAVVATASGDVPLESNLLGSSPDNLLVLTTTRVLRERLAALSSHATAVEILPAKETDEGPRLDLKRALETLKKRYAVGALLVEGGPTLNHSLISEGLADELFLTLAPKVLGGERPGALTVLEGATLPPHVVTRLVSVHLFGDELFLRYALPTAR